MSDYLAVGGVSAVLRSMLTNALTSGGPSTVLGTTPGITATSPDLIATGASEQPQVNLFMYYVSLNPALRNLDLPSANGGGQRLSNPPLALNLHYLVSAYGSKQFDPEILLAWAMKVFHDTPVVPPQTIQDALASLSGSAEAQLIATSTLAQQVEHLRITPETLTTEEIYRLWAAFQAAYRPSTALQVSVVVIQDTEAFTSGEPVQFRNVSVQPLTAPVIDAVSPNMAAAGQQLTITGSNFVGASPADTFVSFDNGTPVPVDTIQSKTVRVSLPASLTAGTRMVRVLRQVSFPPTALVAHPGFSSSPAPFQLIPQITDASPVQAKGGTVLKLTLSPPVGRGQQAILYIGDTAIPLDDRPLSAPASSPTLNFPIPASQPLGTFALRVEIDGAPSALVPAAGGGFTPQVHVIP
ncbi:MAG: DUF4255 domain-containing protein [Actinomycetota bacterium]|nr:DUF4255 domain-containing protein [Actinomycetota bacterium]